MEIYEACRDTIDAQAKQLAEQQSQLDEKDALIAKLQKQIAEKQV